MRLLFDPEGPLMSALGTLADLMLCNILFLVCSIPVFTLGASICALYDCTLAVVEQREDAFMFRQFWRAFRRNFRSGTALWFVTLGGGIILWAYSAAVDMLDGTFAVIYRVTFLVLVFLFLAGAQYLFPIQAYLSGNGRRVKIRTVLKTAWLMSVGAFPRTLAAMVIAAAAVYLTFFLNPDAFGSAVFLWAFLLFAVVAYLQSFLFRKPLRTLNVDRSSASGNPKNVSG